MPAPTRRMNPARERRTWLALVASAGASFAVAMSAREKSISAAHLAHEANRFDGQLRPCASRVAEQAPCDATLCALREVGRAALEKGGERLSGFGRREALGEAVGFFGDASAKGRRIPAQERARLAEGPGGTGG